MMIGEVPIDVTEQFDHLAAERPEQPRCDRAGHAIAAVDRDLHRPRKPDVGDHAFEIACGDAQAFPHKVEELAQDLGAF